MKSVWYYDENYRVYQDDNGNKTSSPNAKFHWRELAVTNETSRSWVLANGVKIPKNKPLPYGYAADIEEVNDRVWMSRNSYKISEKVHSVDVIKMRKIAELIGYES
jgi:hypothetical protein